MHRAALRRLREESGYPKGPRPKLIGPFPLSVTVPRGGLIKGQLELLLSSMATVPV